MNKNLKKTIIGVSLLVVATPVFSDGGRIADRLTQKILPLTEDIDANMKGTNQNTAASLQILRDNFLNGAGYVNSELTGIKQAITAQSEVVRQLSDLQTENLFYLQGAMEMAAAERSVDMTNSDALIDLCINSTASDKASSGRTETKAEKAAGGSQQQMARATSTTNAVAVASRSSLIHDRDYCSVEENIMGYCDIASEMPNADINPASITNGAVKMVTDGEPEIIRDNTNEIVAVNVKLKVKEGEPAEILTFDEQSNDNASMSINNIINPLPDEVIDKTLMDSNSYHDFKAVFNARQARIQTAAKPLLDIKAENQPTLPLKPFIDGLGADSLSEEYKKANYLTEDMIDKITVDGKISVNHFRDLEVSRRYENSRWYEAIGGMDDKARDTEMMSMMALQLSLINKQNKLLESLNLTLSAQLANDLTPLRKDVLESMKPTVR